MPDFPSRLKDLRKTKGVTQKTVAEHLGILEQPYQKYEYGKHKPNYEYVVKLAAYFNVSTDYLLGLSDCPSAPAAAPYVTSEEFAIVEKLRALPPEKRRAIEALLD